MSKLVNIPLFQIGLLFLVGTAIWYFITDQKSPFKKKILAFASDGLYYFLISSFLLNIIFNFKEVIREPYRAILIASDSFYLGLLLTSFYLVFREKRKKLPFTEKRQLFIDQLVNYFLFLGLANHLFYYFKYSNLKSVLFILTYFLLYLLKDKIKYPQRNEVTLILLGFIHYLLSFFLGKVVIYYHIVFYPYQIISLLFVLAALIYYFRRGLPSKQI